MIIFFKSAYPHHNIDGDDDDDNGEDDDGDVRYSSNVDQ